MGSLQSEIQRTLNSWNGTPPDAPVPQRTKSIAWRSFDYLKANPSSTSEDVANALGMDIGRSSATLLSLYQKGKLDRKAYPNPNPDGKRLQVYTYWTAVEDFTDTVARRVPKPKKAKPLSKAQLLVKELDEPVEKRSVGRPRLDMPRMKQFAIPEFSPEPMPFDADAFVATLNVHDAKKIYNLLRKIFG